MKYQEFRDRFFKFGCVSIELIAAFYSVFDRHNLKRWTDSGYLIKLKRGLYAFSDWQQTAGIGEAMASRIYAPSYLSCEWVLARAGLIPERDAGQAGGIYTSIVIAMPERLEYTK